MGAYRNITVQLPYGLYCALKTRSFNADKPYAAIVRQLLEKYLDLKSNPKNMKGVSNG